MASPQPGSARAQYDAFISYRHVERDARWAEWLIEAIENYRVPKPLQAKGLPARLKVFRDEDEMPASGDLNEQIKQALAASRFLIVICSPYTPRSRWVGREIELFERLGREPQVLALLTEGEPFDSFPQALLESHRVIERANGQREIVRQDTEPLAADVRPRKGVAEAEIKRQALLRIVACMLGVGYDVLHQRELKRRRRRLQAYAVAGLGAVSLAGGGAFAYWDHSRPKSSHYRDAVWRWGLPEGFGRLEPETAARRETSIRVVRQRGRIVDVRAENSAGVLRPVLMPGETIAGCRVEYKADGKPDRLACYDSFERPAYQIELRRNGDRMIANFERDNAPLSRSGSVSDLAATPGGERSEITGYAITFDANGFVAEQRFLDPWGTPRPDAENAFGVRFVHSPEGLPLRRAKIAADGSIAVGKSGTAATALAYDGEHRLVRVTRLGPDDRPVAAANGAAITETAYDAAGNRVSESTLDASGRPISNAEGFARLAISYDARGNAVERVSFDVNGAPIELRGSGCAKLKYSYDNSGNRTEEFCFASDNAPVLSKDGTHKTVTRYDTSHRETEWAYFGIDDRPILHKDGMARDTFAYDARGNMIERAYWGLDGNLIEISGGYARLKYKYNERGNITETAYFGIDGLPTLSWHLGAARLESRYDRLGNVIEQTSYGIDGRPVVDRNGAARIRSRYDSSGHLVQRQYFGADDQPITNKSRIAAFTVTYDERGNAVALAYTDPKGAPTENHEGCARWERVFNGRGLRVQSSCFGVDGRPQAGQNGCAVLRRGFDERSRQNEIACFNTEGTPALHRTAGGARVTSRFDDRGHLLERAYFGIDGKPMNNREHGTARVTRTYDARGNQIETRYFGIDGQPTTNNRGFSRWAAGYDARGNIISEAHFGIDGRPTSGSGSYARVERVFDERDRLIAANFYDAEGNALAREIAVEHVDAGSIAMKAGVRVNDRLHSYDGQRLFAVFQARRLADEAVFGVPHELVVRRSGERISLQVTSGALGVSLRIVAPGEVLRPRRPFAPPPAADLIDLAGAAY
jgi:YD repeat-containing protein